MLNLAVLLWSQVNTTYKKDPVAFSKAWLTAHMKSSQSLGKPFIVEEFGKNVYDRSVANIAQVRDPVFAAVYDALADSLKSGGVFRGETVHLCPERRCLDSMTYRKEVLLGQAMSPWVQSQPCCYG